jgi:hypothetical protein
MAIEERLLYESHISFRFRETRVLSVPKFWQNLTAFRYFR